jgi:hypothetical protein
MLCQSAPAGCEGTTRDFVTKVVQAFAVPLPATTRDQIVAVLRERSYFDAVGGPSSTRGAASPFVDDLYVVCIVDSPGSTRSVGSQDLEAIHLTWADLPAPVRTNLTNRLGHLPDTLGSAKPGDVTVLATGSYFESSRLLLSDDWP